MHYGHWGATTRGLRAALRRQNEILAQRVRVEPGDRVLDAGCGVGGSAIYLAAVKRCQAIGITLSEPTRDESVANLVARADRAMYQVKHHGKGDFALAPAESEPGEEGARRTEC